MTDFAADLGQKYEVSGARRALVLLIGEFTIGATGAVSSSDVDDPAVTLTRDSAGTYDLTYPKCPKVFIDTQLESDGTVIASYLTAKDANAGTATFVTEDGATPTVTDPESGAKITVWIWAETRS